MILVDSCGWLEYFADGPNAEDFAPAILDRRRLLVPTICVLEVFRVLYRQGRETAALRASSQMQQGQVVGLDVSLAFRAAKLGFESRLPLADSIILATAQIHHAVVWTQDADFKGIRGVKYIERKTGLH
jgi:toxin FitB